VRRLLSLALLAVVVTGCQSKSGQAAINPAAPTGPFVARLAVNQNSYNFPATPIGQAANSPSFDVSATGSGTVVVANIASSNPAEFPLINASGCIGMTLQEGSASVCKMAVKFQPNTTGVRSAQITVTANDGSTIAVDVFGSAMGGSSSDGGGSGGGDGGGDGGSFPQAPCVPNTTGGIALNVINSSAFVIQVTLAGPTRLTFAVPPTGIQVIAAQPGSYTLTGDAPGFPNATFTPSSWSIVNGCDYLLWLKQR
jgi:putative VirB-like lipoprotein